MPRSVQNRCFTGVLLLSVAVTGNSWGRLFTPRVPAFGSTPSHVPGASGIFLDVPLDLNTASAAELRALPGMGDAYVRRVIAGRPYTAKNQLVNRGVLPQAAYERIRDRIVAHRVSSIEPH